VVLGCNWFYYCNWVSENALDYVRMCMLKMVTKSPD
jgi:hypothetical protein